MELNFKKDGALMAFTLLLGLGLEVMVFGAIERFELFVTRPALVDGAIVFGMSLGYLVFSSHLITNIFPVGRIPAMTLSLLAGMWAWAAVMALVFFLVFLLMLALYSLIYVPISGLSYGLTTLKNRLSQPS
jgi:hypothetical protein